MPIAHRTFSDNFGAVVDPDILPHRRKPVVYLAHRLDRRVFDYIFQLVGRQLDFQKLSDIHDGVMGPRFQILEGQKQDIFPVTFSPPRRGKMVPGSIESPV